jgi:hypothetical protein
MVVRKCANHHPRTSRASKKLTGNGCPALRALFCLRFLGLGLLFLMNPRRPGSDEQMFGTRQTSVWIRAMLYAIILICSLNVSPLDCDKVTARLWENVPGGNELPQMCMMRAQVWAAEHGITPRDGEYPKVNCSRHEFGARVG